MELYPIDRMPEIGEKIYVNGDFFTVISHFDDCCIVYDRYIESAEEYDCCIAYSERTRKYNPNIYFIAAEV